MAVNRVSRILEQLDLGTRPRDTLHGLCAECAREFDVSGVGVAVILGGKHHGNGGASDRTAARWAAPPYLERGSLRRCPSAFAPAATTGASGDDPVEDDPSGGGDAAIATVGAGLELLAAQTYTGALDAATSGALGEVSAAVAEFATTAQAHHQAASDALAEAAGGITAEVDPDIKATVDAAFAEVTDITGLASSPSASSCRRPPPTSKCYQS